MKKLDKLVLGSFLGPFVMTFLVVVFILLTQHMLKYFDDIIGKDLGWVVLGSLLFYFAVCMIPVALPLAILLSSLITFGNLGEHFELTAIKSLGISLVRALAPIFVTVLFLTGIAFLSNNYLVPKAALEAYSLLYDIKQKKPSLDLKEGAFYGAIPEVSIKVAKKYPDGATLEGVVIYDHRGRSGNKEVIIADSGRMYTILNDNYLKLELYRGYNYSQGTGTEQQMTGQPSNTNTYSKTKFDQTYMVFDLSAFNLNRTDKRWFQGNRIMRNLGELTFDMDSVDLERNKTRLTVYDNAGSMFSYFTRTVRVDVPENLSEAQRVRDSAEIAASTVPEMAREIQKSRITGNFGLTEVQLDSALRQRRIAYRQWNERSREKVDSLLAAGPTASEISAALMNARSVKTYLLQTMESLKSQGYEFRIFQIQWHKIFANSASCLIMFLIGAPLGAIIKKGGLGFPVLASIIFFIIFYVLSIIGEKWAKQEMVTVPVGMWAPNAILLVVGALFLIQARKDARFFESDFYKVVFERLLRRFRSQKQGI
ncbi:MAG: LptF/LptG family permease [Bacteroidetes bacterium]|nr:LptF/LptG family permease [Bacteroidota bacterium]